MDETIRIEDLPGYRILDTIPEREFDEIVELAAAICDMPLSFISLVGTDRQWFKSTRDSALAATVHNFSFCQHTLGHPDEVLVVNDVASDDRFKDNPLVTGPPYLRFYAAAPLKTPSGNVLGTLCVLDMEPRELSGDKRHALQILSRKAMELLELRTQAMAYRQDKQKTEELLQKVTDQAPGVIFQFEISPQGGQSFTFVSKGISEIQPGLTPELLREHPELAFSSMDVRDRPLVNACLQYSFEHLIDWDLEFRVKGSDGTLKWNRGKAHPERREDGTTVWYGTIQDITVEKNRQAALATAILDSEEKERKRLASELHDSFGQTMAAILFSLKILRKANPDGNHSDVIGLVTAGITEYRNISRNLYPADLQMTPLCELIRDKANLFNAMSPADVTFEHGCQSDEPIAAPSYKKDIYRIFQELTNNAMKYANAREIRIRVCEEDSQLVLEVADDGVGFNLTAQGKSINGGIGLASLAGRAEVMGGQFSLRTAPGQGTTATLRVPLHGPAR